jgi:hypothetical protein
MTTLQQGAAMAGAGKGAVLQAGVDQISEQQQFTFTKYSRLILPADGYVFWAPTASLNPNVIDPSLTFTAPGSLHLSQRTEQNLDSTVSRQTVIFTAEQQILEFSDMADTELFFMTLPNGSLAAFSSQNMRYDTSDLWHYAGVAVLPYEASQIVATPADVLTNGTIVSNSLPIWMAMSTTALPIYPSDLSPMNLVPPYITADIQGTQALTMAPLVDSLSGQAQLCKETVVFTLWGCRNNDALDFQSAILANSMPDDAPYGTMTPLVPVDLKKPQPEFAIIAQQKSMTVDVNYLQSRTRDIARQLILEAFITVSEG